MIKGKKEKKSFSLAESGINVKDFGNKEEKRIAKKIGARQTPASGATKFMKGDMLKGTNMIDAKSTNNLSFTVTVADLQKLESDAFMNGKNPVLLLNFPKAKLATKEWVLVPYDRFFN